MNKYIFKKNIVFIGVFIVSCFVMSTAVLWNGSDDFFHSPAAQQMGIIEWVVWRTQNWQPRIISDFLTALFGMNLPVWKIFTSLIMTVLLFFVCKFGNYQDNHIAIIQRNDIITCSSFWFMMPFVISSSICWYTGSFHYLWPATFLIISLLPFYYAAIGYHGFNNVISRYVAPVCSGLAMYNEQPAAIFLCFGIYTFLVLIIRKESIPKRLIFSYIFAIINIAIYLSLGGVGIRQDSELQWYKDFPMLTSVDKLFQGINWTNYNILNASNILVLVLTGMILVLAYYRFHLKITRFLCSIPVIVVLLGVLPISELTSRFSNVQVYLTTDYHLSLGDIIKHVLNPMVSRPGNFALSFSDLFPSFFCLFIVLYIPVLIFVLYKNVWKGLTNAVIYFAALASSWSLSFSPTIFASGNRIFFITNILFVVLISSLLNEISQYINLKDSKKYNLLCVIFLSIAAIFIIEQIYLNLTGGCRY